MIAAAGGIFALGPIIIHILFRWRYRTIDFGAMRFLLESLRRSRQRLRMEELILIALRVLACGLLGLALADVRVKSLLPGGAAPTAHVFILDDSMSMAQRAGTCSLYQKATEYVAHMIRHMGDTDLVAIVSATRPDSGQPVGTPALARDLKEEDFLERLAGLRPTDLRAKFPQAISAAADLLKSQKEVLGKVYVVSDFRRVDFVGQKAGEDLRTVFEGLVGETRAQLFLLDFGLPSKHNLTVEKITTSHKLIVAGASVPFQVAVRNHGTEAVEKALLSAQVGDTTLPAISLGPIGPGATATADFEYVFPAPGPAGVKVSLPADDLAADNEASLAVDVRDAMQILVLDENPDAVGPASASFCLAGALDPSGSGAFNQRVAVRSLESVPEHALREFDVVFMTNIKAFRGVPQPDGTQSYPQLQLLEKFVREGGGLGIFLGDRTDVAFYNGPMYAGGAGLSPLPLAEGPPPAIDPSRYLRLRPDSIAPEHMLRIFTGKSERFTRLVRFYGHVPVEPGVLPKPAGHHVLMVDVGPPQVLAAFEDPAGSPACVRRRYGKGQVIVWYSSPDTRWTDWPKNLTFLPVMNDMAWQLARSESESHHGTVGDKIVYPVPPRLADATSISLKLPSYPAEDVRMLQPRGEGSERVITYAAANQAGLYEMAFTLPRGRQTVLFSRHFDPQEGDLAKATEDEVAAAVGQQHAYSGNLALAADALEDTSPRKAYWWMFLAGVLGVLVLENWLGRVFGHYGSTRETALGRRP
jgi:hypothetical protein